MLKRLVCLVRGHQIEVITEYEFDPDQIVHTWTQIRRCLRCGRILAKVITKL